MNDKVVDNRQRIDTHVDVAHDVSAVAADVCVYLGAELARYHFGASHPFGPQRLGAFEAEFKRLRLHEKVRVRRPVQAEQVAIERFHTHQYVQRVIKLSRVGIGFLDYGDTPAIAGIYEAAATVVGSTLDALDCLMNGLCRRAFVPIAGLHHARRDSAAGFCVFNDCGVAIETLRRHYNVRRIAYVDIDAHHGDGVYYAFDDDPDLFFADLHEDGRYLYPGSGAAEECGRPPAVGTKLNIPMPPAADDEQFAQAWQRVEQFLHAAAPEIILLQCGADSLAGDPLTHLAYTPASHALATRRLCRLADEYCAGRLLVMGGGGYNLGNIAQAWTAVVNELVLATNQCRNDTT